MKRMRFGRWVLVAGCLLAAASAVWTQPPAGNGDNAPDRKAAAPAAPAPAFWGIGVVFVANGSGDDDQTLSVNLRDALRGAHLPFAVDTTVWTLDRGGVVDHLSIERQFEKATWMAARVLAFRKAYPDRLVVLMGHSTGTHVVLRAAEMLPEKTVDRIILLAPSVACNYDLRPALRSSRGGIDNYWSTEDGVLELAADKYGTADRQYGIACAGRVGFAVPAKTCPDAALYAALRQYRWNTSLERYGHLGNHFGWIKTRLLQNVIVPTLMISEGPVVEAKK